MDKIKLQKAPVINPSKRKVQWIKPKFVAEIEFLELTKHGDLRAPSFKPLKEDKSEKYCIWEEQF